MSLSPRHQLISWGIAFTVFILVLWVLGDILLPFVIGLALAYLIDPLADRLERLGCSRIIACLIITVVAFAALILALMFIIPVLIRQLTDLLEFIPILLEALHKFLISVAPALLERDNLLSAYSGEIGSMFTNYGTTIIAGIYNSARSAVGSMIFMLIVPVIMIYMLIDWDRMIGAIDSYLPLDHADEIRSLFLEMDRVLSSFVRGQLSVCVILAGYYSLLLIIIGLDFGLVVGIVAGLVSFIPFVGAIFGGALAIGLAVFQFWSEPLFIAAVVAVFLTGQVLEGNILTPRIVGKSVGLHPVMLLFALSAFGLLFGFVGILVAVPAAAVTGVLFRFGMRQYLASGLYLGRSRGQN